MQFSFEQEAVTNATNDISTASASSPDAETEPPVTPENSAPATSRPIVLSLATPDLKFAVADLPKIFAAYYKTKQKRAELNAWKGDSASKQKELKIVHAELMAELEQVIATYSEAHDLDAVLDSGAETPTSGAPFVLYFRPKLDITSDVIALANTGHETN